jgi:hypothetical protein
MAASTQVMPNFANATAPAPGAEAVYDDWTARPSGLIGTAYKATNTDAYTPNSATAGVASTTNASASKWNVDNPQTVQGQVKNIIDDNSPLMQQAQTRSLQQMNGRGLINSSMAVGAGQSALYDAALPMAQQDASTYANAAKTNADYGQQVGMFNAAAANDTSKVNAGFTQQTNLANTAAQNTAKAQDFEVKANASAQEAAAKNQLQSQSNTIRQQGAMTQYQARIATAAQDLDNKMKAAMQNADSATKAQLMTLDGEIKAGLASVEANYKTLIQTSASASQMYSTTMDMIAKIMGDADIEDKSTAINGYLGWMEKGMNLIGSVNGINLTDADGVNLLDFGTTTVTSTTT